MPPDEPTDEAKQEQLPQDNATPFNPAAPSPDPAAGVVNDPVTQAQTDSTLDDTHPATDTGLQQEESYDAGLSGAAGVQEPNAGDAVAGYTPPADTAQESSAPGVAEPEDSSAEASGENDVTVG